MLRINGFPDNFLILLNAITLHKIDANSLANCSIYLGFRSINLQTPRGTWFMLTDSIECRSTWTNEYNTTVIDGQLRKTHTTHLQGLQTLRSLENSIKATINIYIHTPIHTHINPPPLKYLCVYEWACVYMYEHIHTCTHTHTSMHIQLCVYTHTCICTHDQRWPNFK